MSDVFCDWGREPGKTNFSYEMLKLPTVSLLQQTSFIVFHQKNALWFLIL